MRRTLNFLFNLGEEVQDKKLSIGFLIDLSGSMQGKPLHNLKNALIQLLNPLVQYNTNTNSTDKVPAADEVLLMTFATEVQKVCPWVKQEDYDFFKELLLAVPEAIFGKSGCTALIDGVYDILTEFTKAKNDNEKILIIFSDGGEYGSKRKKSELINKIQKYKQGFLTTAEYSSLAGKINKSVLELFFEKSDEDYVFKKDFLNKIKDTQIESPLKKELINLQQNSINDVKIYSLFYAGDGFRGKKNLLQEFSNLTQGKVYDSPKEESIPAILNELVMDILYEEKSSLRNKLFRRLSSTSDLPWYKLITINRATVDQGNLSYHNNFDNPIYYVNTANIDDTRSTRQEYYKLFEKVYQTDIYDDLKNCIEDNSTKLSSVTGINSQLNLLIVLSGNDRLGISSAEYLVNDIRSKISKLVDVSTKVWTKLVILLERFKDYSDQEKQELYAFLNEINQTEKDVIHTIYLISDYNKYAHNSNDGFIYLENYQYEDLVTEILFDLNYNQDLDNRIVGGTVDQTGESSRFVAIGGTSAFLNKKEYTNALTKILTADFLTNLFNKNKIQISEDLVQEKFREFINYLSYDIISKRFIDCHPQNENIFDQLGCPSINGFTPLTKEIVLQMFNKNNPRLEKVSISRSYSNFVDYVTLLFYDIIDYIDSSHSIEFFEAELDRRLDELFKEYYAKLKSFVNSTLYEYNKGSSPLAAKEFIDRLYSYLKEKLATELENDFNNDPLKRKINQWMFTNSEGVEVPPGNPTEDLNELKKQIENFPIPWSIRFRYGSFACLSGGITLTILWMLGVGIWGILPALILGLGLVAFGEFKVRTSYKKLQNIINKYENSHKYYTWKKAFGIYCEKIKNFYETLKTKVRRENADLDDPFLLNQYSESELIDFFSHATTKTLPNLMLMEEKQKVDFNMFHFSLKYLMIKNLYESNVSVKSDNTIALKNDIIEEIKKLGIDLTLLNNSKQLLDEILGNLLHIQLKDFPSVLVGPIPFDLNSLSLGLQSKLDLLPLIKGREYLLTLLQDLTKDEKEELINVWREENWIHTVEKLIFLRKQQKETENNLFVLWREIVWYEIWLKKIKDLVRHSITNTDQIESKFNFDNVFYVWKDMYFSRRKFKAGLNKVFEKKAKELVEASFDIWKILSGLNKDTNIYSLLNSYSYPALSVIATNILEYPRIYNYYSANESISINNLKNKNFDLESEFPAKTTTNDWEFSSISLDSDQVYFNKIYYLNLLSANKYSLFNSILESFKNLYRIEEDQSVYQKMKKDNGLIEKLFLEKFKSEFLSTEKKMKRFRFIGEINK